jgi:phage terminase large subunit-like protein
LRKLPPHLLKAAIEGLTNEQAEALRYDWHFWARPNQFLPDGDWFIWLILAGRGFGKTRIGAETVRAWAGEYPRIALIGQTAADVRDVMVEGESGILAIHPRDKRPLYEPSKRRLTWPNGAIATTYSGDDPDQLRGPQHHKLWGDEPAKWRYAQDTHDNAMMGLRLGMKPQGVYTTTPRPTPFIKKLVKRAHAATGDGSVYLTRGSTFDNLDNLAEPFREVIKIYAGTRLGRQELEAEVLEDVEGALWTLRAIEDTRVQEAPDLLRIVVAIDPAVTATEESDETGIVAAGKGWCSCKGTREQHYFVLGDYSVGRAAPAVWAARAINAYHDLKADRLVAEKNNGGLMIRSVISSVDSKVPVQLISATRGKLTRAEPISMLYEQGQVHHVGAMPLLEEQMTTYVPGDGDSPDRMDAAVWAITLLKSGGGFA